MEGIYKVNLIPSDLGPEESILQIADTLENLQGIVDDVFAKLMTRINRNMDKTNKLKERIEISRQKVEKLTGMQKAVKVFSSAKYPASIKHDHYESFLEMDGYQHEPKKVVLSGKTQEQPSDKGIQEKLHFYHVKVGQPKSSKPKPDFDLNKIIDDISTIGELLVFNTDESPYLGTVTKTSAYVPRVAVDEGKSLLEAAPSSIMNRDVLKRDVDEYLYAPGMGLVPELEMPLDLPDLPGVAGDVQFLITNDGSIAPSVVTSPITPITQESPLDLPDLKDLPAVHPPKAERVPEVYVTDLPDVAVDLPEVPDVPDVPMMAPPPPPPPPPPMMVEAPVSRKGEAAPAPVGDAHSSLMAAIRQAGGAGRAKLRSAAEQDHKPSKPSGGGDLMADLHAKLSMRRRGISGAERHGGTVLHTLASVIPEPDASSAPGSDTDNDWE